MTEKEISTEEKILEAASKVFTEKGFSGTRTVTLQNTQE
jgi:AcrR family transcriptional regulator